MRVHATLIVEDIYTFSKGTLPAVRVVPHDEEGKRPRGKKGDGILVVAKEGETHADVLRAVAGYLEQEEFDWSGFTIAYGEGDPAARPDPDGTAEGAASRIRPGMDLPSGVSRRLVVGRHRNRGAMPDIYAERLLAEVRRLRDGIKALASEYGYHDSMPVPADVVAFELRALVEEDPDEEHRHQARRLPHPGVPRHAPLLPVVRLGRADGTACRASALRGDRAAPPRPL